MQLFHEPIDAVGEDAVAPGELLVDQVGDGGFFRPGHLRPCGNELVGVDPGLQTGEGGGGDAVISECGNVGVGQVVDFLRWVEND